MLTITLVILTLLCIVALCDKDVRKDKFFYIFIYIILIASIISLLIVIL